MPTATLADRAIIDVSGPDAEHFLQNILTLDLDALGDRAARPGALLAPQGKIMFDFLVSRSGENALRLECRADIADDFVRRLTLYRLRAKAEISKQDQPDIAVSWQDDSAASQSDSTVRDSRFLSPVFRHYGAAPVADASEADWHAFRIANGVAESGPDYALSDAFPHDVLLDLMGGVGFKKGCFIGQEVVSRMQHRGTARRRVLLVSAASDLPAPGTDLVSGGKLIGTLGSVSGTTGIAIARIDRVKAALDAGAEITAGDVAITPAIPGWAGFTYPEAASAEDA
ncbi:CAF17-like 4Fe-4S cluster assembly/insertion protein YgfZ [Aminobacter niigataensis]|uniref:CAF17-like 4Fe-4S cluster assembly/insertion protein YgfZ n=1 Tax=Aminobacter niigataensis TaxID=83265 RepID=UPI0024C9FBCA|nr:folate-binding protein YgfZ [Aminobacter niigataensis]CAI2935553.1 tRNA-modifying protein YgfZ [Aminobacter niigataensis]